MSDSGKGTIIPIFVEDEMRKAYIDYALSVITSRALPDAYDGLKPVQRRILYVFYEMGIHYNSAYKKTARPVGEVLGKYHPHGNQAIYDALVRLAQKFSLRYPLIEGQGNFGSIDGDPPAAMRYTEGRMRRILEDGLLVDIQKKTVDFRPNFDNTLKEPTILPGPLPNLLVNGASGIAVGMATQIAPHHLGEVSKAICATIDNPEITLDGLMEHMKGPDFPTGGIIYGLKGIRDAFSSGKGKVVVRGRTRIEENQNRTQIIVSEIPYMVNKATMIEKTIALVNQKSLLGITDIRDESDREGMRVVYDLKRDAVPNVVLNNLFKKTPLQSAFNVNNVALVRGKPQLLTLRGMIDCYITHRHEVILRRTQEEKRQAEATLHILEGYIIALDHIDPVVQLIKRSKDTQSAKEALIKKYALTEIQAKSILEMRLQRLTGLERDKVVEQHKKITQELTRLNDILADKALQMDLMKKELQFLADRYGDKRRTEITEDEGEFVLEDTIPNETMVITLSEQGYIKRTPLYTYRQQQRGGVGSKGVSTKKEDFPSEVRVANAHDYLLFFTEAGQLYWAKVHTLPEGSKTAQGRAIQNILPIAADDRVRSIIKVESLKDKAYVERHHVVMATKKGIIKKVPLSAFSRPMNRGIRAINFKENDRLLEARLTQPGEYIVLAVRSGKAVCFPADEVRPMGRSAAGVRGITLGYSQDEVIGMISTPYNKEISLLVVSEKGYGKRSSIEDYRITRRGAKGVKTLQITQKTGDLIAIKRVQNGDDLMIMNRSGIIIRIAVDGLRKLGRLTQGVRLVKLRKEDQIAAVVSIQDMLTAQERAEQSQKKDS